MPATEAVKVELQLAVPVDPARRTHELVLNDPATPLSVKETLPDGVIWEPLLDGLSVTDAMHVAGWLTTTGVVQFTVVVVARRATVMPADVL